MIPWYEIAIFVGGAIAGSLISQVIQDIYPLFKKLVFDICSRIYYYFPHKIWKRWKQKQRSKEKREEILEAIQNDQENNDDQT